jgi:hypothetical protein
MILRLACALAIGSQLVLLALLLAPSGASAIAFSFLGAPLLATAMALGLLWWSRERRKGRCEDD